MKTTEKYAARVQQANGNAMPKKATPTDPSNSTGTYPRDIMLMRINTILKTAKSILPTEAPLA